MKKILKVFGIITIVFFVIGFTELKAYTTFSVSSPKQVVVGKSFTVKVTLSSSDILGSWSYSLNYNSKILRLTSGTNPVVSYGDGSKKSVAYSYTFQAIASGTSAVTLKSYDVVNWDEVRQTPSVVGSSVKVITQSQLEATYSKDNYLKSLNVDGFNLNPTFNKDVNKYTINVASSVEKINISASVNDARSNMSGTGQKDISEGTNTFEIKVVAQNGSERIYTLQVIVEDKNPIEVTIEDKKYTVIKRKSLLEGYETFEDKEVTIGDTKVPGFYSQITDITLVGLKNEDGQIVYASYKDNKYELYKEMKFDINKIRLLDIKENSRFSDYKLNKTIINDSEVKAYVVQNNLFIIYGTNIETGENGYYLYDKKLNSITTYEDGLINLYKEKLNATKKTLLIIIGENLLLFMIIVSLVIYEVSKNKKKIARKKNNKEKK